MYNDFIFRITEKDHISVSPGLPVKYNNMVIRIILRYR